MKYSFNGAPLDKVLELPKCNPAEPFSLPADFQPYMKVGDDVKSMSVEVTYADGTKSGREGIQAAVSYSTNSLTLAALPLASITVSSENPDPSGAQRWVRRREASGRGMPLASQR